MMKCNFSHLMVAIFMNGGDFMTEKEIIDIKKELINEIYTSLVKSITGKRFTGMYIINGTSNVKVIELITDDGCPTIRLYFDRQIQIAISRDNSSLSIAPMSVFYTYFGDTDDIPDDVNDFVELSKKFLFELIKHTNSLGPNLENYPMEYQQQIKDDYPNADNYQKEFGHNCPDNLKPYADLNKILEYPFKYKNKEDILHMLFVFQSKNFKIIRTYDYRKK